MERNESLVKAGVAGALVRFAAPVMLANILQVIYFLTDLLILGNFATTADVSGATIGSQIMLFVTLGLNGLIIGLTVTLGQLSGSKNEKGLSAAIGTAIPLFSVIPIVITILLFIFNRQIISLMRTPPEAVEAASSFLRISTFGLIFAVGFNVVGGMFRGLGNSKLPLLFMAISSSLNIVLALIFVRNLNMGAGGAAAATVIAQAVSFLCALLYIKRKGLGFSLSRANIRIDKPVLAQIVRVGAPISLQEILVTFSFLLITAAINSMGVDASAAVGVVERLIMTFMMPPIAMSSAVAAMSSHNIGAGEPRRAEKCMWTGMLISLAFAIPAAVFSWFGGSILVSIFNNEPNVVHNATLYLRTYAFDAIGVAVVFLFNAFFSSLNRSVFAMVHSLFTTFVIRVPIALLLARTPGITLFSIGLAAPLASLGSMIICFVYFIYLKRKGTLVHMSTAT